VSAAITIRRACKDDAALLASLHRDCFSEHWSSESFESLLRNAATLALIATASGEPQEHAAFIAISIAADQAEILTLGTVPAKRREGLARALVLAASAEAYALGAMEVFLEVASNNAAAAALYASLGFAVSGRRARYYRDKTGTIDAMIMRISLPLAR
jgi:ribosomal-protein-alanine N-acetyltransferase